MNVYKLPADLKAIIFDIDGTLYTCQEYVLEQVDAQIRHYAELKGITELEARTLIEGYRKEWSRTHEGKKISLANTLISFGITIDESIEWRNTLMEPERYLKTNPDLVKALTLLKEKYALLAVTNNPVFAARRTLRAIGIPDDVMDIIGLDTCKKSKPAPEVLELASKTINVQPGNILSIGDRYDIDLALPLEMGMGAVLVDGAEDVISLVYDHLLKN